MHCFSSSDQDQVLKGHYPESVPSTEPSAYATTEIHPSPCTGEMWTIVKKSAISIDKCCGSDIVSHTCTWKTEAGESLQIQGQPNLHRKLQASQTTQQEPDSR